METGLFKRVAFKSARPVCAFGAMGFALTTFGQALSPAETKAVLTRIAQIRSRLATGHMVKKGMEFWCAPGMVHSLSSMPNSLGRVGGGGGLPVGAREQTHLVDEYVDRFGRYEMWGDHTLLVAKPDSLYQRDLDWTGTYYVLLSTPGLQISKVGENYLAVASTSQRVASSVDRGALVSSAHSILLSRDLVPIRRTEASTYPILGGPGMANPRRNHQKLKFATTEWTWEYGNEATIDGLRIPLTSVLYLNGKKNGSDAILGISFKKPRKSDLEPNLLAPGLLIKDRRLPIEVFWTRERLLAASKGSADLDTAKLWELTQRVSKPILTKRYAEISQSHMAVFQSAQAEKRSSKFDKILFDEIGVGTILLIALVLSAWRTLRVRD